MIEALEHRRLLAAAAVDLHAGFHLERLANKNVVFYGTNARDRMSVREEYVRTKKYSSESRRLYFDGMSADGTRFHEEVLAGRYTGIQVLGGPGGDKLQVLGDVERPVTLDGGGGNDTLVDTAALAPADEYMEATTFGNTTVIFPGSEPQNPHNSWPMFKRQAFVLLGGAGNDVIHSNHQLLGDRIDGGSGDDDYTGWVDAALKRLRDPASGRLKFYLIDNPNDSVRAVERVHFADGYLYRPTEPRTWPAIANYVDDTAAELVMAVI